MAKDDNSKVSLGFIVVIAAIAAVTVYYLSLPRNEDNDKNGRVYSELQKVDESSDLDFYDSRSAKKQISNKASEDKKSSVKNDVPEFVLLDVDARSNIKYAAPKTSSKDFYSALSQIKIFSVADIQQIIDKLALNNGYPAEILRVAPKNASNVKSEIPGSFSGAYFDIPSGTMLADVELLKSLDSRHSIAVLAHEFNHFDNTLKICKSTGLDNFINLIKSQNPSGINKDFWERASRSANISNFSADDFTEDFKKLLNNNIAEKQSPYAVFKFLSNSVNTKFENSAYSVSDNVASNTGISRPDGFMRSVNSVFSAYYKPDSAIFDFLFAQAVINNFPDIKQTYDECISSKNGDLTEFWMKFSDKVPYFFENINKVDKSSFPVLNKLFNETVAAYCNDTGKLRKAEAYKTKINTRIHNVKDINDLNLIAKTAENYLTFMYSRDGLYSDKDELTCFLVLIASENNILPSSGKSSFLLYDLTIPSVIRNQYAVKNRKQKYNFIFSNQAFKDYSASRRALNPEMSDSDILIELLTGFYSHV